MLSLGWGVQSFGLAAMSALGVLPPIDVALHADTGHERSATYEFARRWTPWLQDHGVTVITVQADDESNEVMFDETNGQTMIPLYTVSLEDRSHGMLRRTCTSRWKIQPQRSWIRQELERRDLQLAPGIVEQWFGITLDEVQRMRQSDVQYIEHVYPFVELLERPWTRGMVVRWLRDNNLEIPPRSACVFCPYQSDREWRHLQQHAPADFAKATATDSAIRHKRPGYLSYLHRQRTELPAVDLRSEEDHGQLTLWAQDCGGECWL